MVREAKVIVVTRPREARVDIRTKVVILTKEDILGMVDTLTRGAIRNRTDTLSMVAIP